MTVLDPAIQAARIRGAEFLSEDLTPIASDRLSGEMDYADTSDAALRREAKRIVETKAQPEDFKDGRAASYYAALRRRILEERKVKRGAPVDINARLREADQLLSRLGRYR